MGAPSSGTGPGPSLEQSTAISMSVQEYLDLVQIPEHADTRFTSGSVTAADAVHAHLDRIHRLLRTDDDDVTPPVLQCAAGDRILGVPAQRPVQVAFSAPDEVAAVGSVCQRTTAGVTDLQLDVVLALPASLFQNKDYLDRRYFVRRALYLVQVQSRLQAAYQVDVVPAPSCTLLPCLRLRRRNDERHLWDVNGHELQSIRIMTRICPEIFIGRRLAPLRNALRTPDATKATPFYNQVLLHEMYRHEHVRWLREWHQLCPGLAAAAVLARRWLARRHIRLSGFVVDVMIAYLHECNRIVSAMTPWQMYRALLMFLTEVDLTQGLAIALVDDFPLQAFTAAFPVTFVASCGRCNLLYDLPLYTYERIRHEARLVLQSQTITFSQLFLDECPTSIVFDAHLYVTVPSDQLDRYNDAITDRSALINLSITIQDLLIQAYTDRVTLIDIVSIGHDTNTLRIGLLLNENEYDRILDRGPSADSTTACATFRHLWGDLSNLRRFRDGTMAEAVVWSDPEAVLADIAQYVLQRHLGLAATRAVLARDLVRAARLPEPVPVDTAFAELCRQLRALDDLPLQICSISSPCPSLRRCRACTTGPLATDVLPDPDPVVYRDLIPVVIQFESSARWPEDLTAIGRVKSALLLRLASLVSQQTTMSATAFPSSVVVWCDGFAFRLCIYHTREMTIRRTERDFAAVPKTMDPAENIAELTNMERDLVHRPLIATELHSLCQRFSTMPATVRLLKRWINAHLFADQFDDEALELLAGHVFLHPAPFPRPSSPLSAFCQILHLIYTYDWEAMVLVVDLHEDLTHEQRSEMQKRYVSESGTGAMRIATFRDLSSSMWKTPSLEMLRRLKAVAKSALDHLCSVIDSLSSDLTTIKTTFKAPYSRYDLFIKLNSKFVPYSEWALFPSVAKQSVVERKFKPPVPSSELVRERVANCSAGLSPVQKLVECLRSAFDGIATFSCDYLGSDLVVGKFIRGKNQARKLKLGKTNLCYMRPIESGQVDLNVDQIMSDIRRLGDGIVMNIFTDFQQYKASL